MSIITNNNEREKDLPRQR